MKKEGENIFTSFLNSLNVKHTKTFSNKYFNEHPHKYNLFGLSKMLSDYGVENAGTRIENKEENIMNIETPFVAHIGADFALVYDVTDEEVKYRTGHLNINMPRKDFCDAWTGVVLLAETTPDSAEPGYKKNREKELLQFSLKSSLIIAVLALLSIVFVNNHSYSSIGLLLLLVLNAIGVYIGFLLVQKQLKIHSNYSDKICSLFKQADCNNILESDAAKLWGVFGWSEIGFSYFIANFIIVVFLPHLINYYAIIGVCVLPYTVWSIWYQRFKAKQWCVLCLIVQLLLWCLFITNLSFHFVKLPDFILLDIVILGCIYFIPFVVVTLLIPYLSEQSKIETITQEINSLKSNEKVFGLLLKEQPKYPCDKSTSNILFGNQDADILITILTNPHCNPCAKMHARIEKLLESGIQNLCIQYIFSSFGEDLDISNRFLIASYQNNSQADMRSIYSQWFAGGKLDKDAFIVKYPFNLTADDVIKEFEKHLQWKSETKLAATPTVLVNGYKLPDNYQIEDLRYFSKI